MRWMHAGVAAAALFAGPVLADDAQQTAMQTMHDAMAEQATLPAGSQGTPGQPSTVAQHRTGSPQDQAQRQQHQADQAASQAQQHAAMHASHAAASHADIANRTAMDGAMGTTMGTCQAGSDCQNAAGMMRSRDPSSGAMGGSMMGGGATPGSSTTTGGTPGGTMYGGKH